MNRGRRTRLDSLESTAGGGRDEPIPLAQTVEPKLDASIPPVLDSFFDSLELDPSLESGYSTCNGGDVRVREKKRSVLGVILTLTYGFVTFFPKVSQLPHL